MQLFTKCNSSVLHSGESHPATTGGTNTTSSTLTMSQLIIKYPLGQKSIPLSPLVSYLYHLGSKFFFPPLSQWWQIVLIYSWLAWSNRAEAWYWIAVLRVCWGSLWSRVSPDEPLALSHLIWTYVFAVVPLNSSTTKYLQ